MSRGADKKANARAEAHLRFVICVSLRMAASAEAPLSPIVLRQRLQRVGEVGRAREQACQRALTQKRTLGGGGGALERRERRRRGQQLAQHDRSRHADASPPQVELRDAVLAQRGERDPAVNSVIAACSSTTLAR